MPNNRKKHNNSNNGNNQNEIYEEHVGKDISYRDKNGDRKVFLVKSIGTGAYASVWMCYSVNKKTLMAVKIFESKNKSAANNEKENYDKFAKLQIPHINKIIDMYTRHDGKIYMFFDLMVGSLYDVMRHGSVINNNESSHSETCLISGFDLDFAISVSRQALIMLSELHKHNIIHGDIKPENILLDAKAQIHDNLIQALAPKSALPKISKFIRSYAEKHMNNEVDSQDTNDSNDSQNSNNNDNSDNTDNIVDDSEESEGTDTDMSMPPDKIVFSEYDDSDDAEEVEDAEEDNEDTENNDGDNGDNGDNGDDGEDNEDNDTDEIIPEVYERLRIPEKYITDPHIVVSDLGSCVHMDGKKPFGVQTKYYKSPELILANGYGKPCDIWALGCTIYEILTNQIMIDPDVYNVYEDGRILDDKKTMLVEITMNIDTIPNHMIDNSQTKNIFFTNDRIIKQNMADRNNNHDTNIWCDLLNRINHEDRIKKILFVDLLMEMVQVDPNMRITADDALNHPLFSYVK